MTVAKWLDQQEARIRFFEAVLDEAKDGEIEYGRAASGGGANTMTPAASNPMVSLYQGDALEVLATLPAESVHCIVTSPPYWGLRSYSGEQQRVWDAADGCEHHWGEERLVKRGHAGNRATLVGIQNAHLSKAAGGHGSLCLHCPAWRGALGQEPTVELYIEHLMLVLAALWRVLREDGVCWINLDDTRQSGRDGGPKQSTNTGAAHVQPHGNLRPKDMALVPERFILAAQAEGWCVRSKVVWAPPNPMPESASDRPTDAYQMLYCLAKTAKTQFWTHRDLPGVRRQPKPYYRWQRTQPLPENPSWHSSSFSGAHDQALYDGVSEEPREVLVLEERGTPPPGWTSGNKGDWRRVNLWRGRSVWWDQEAIHEEGCGYGRGSVFRSQAYLNDHAFNNSDAEYEKQTHSHSYIGGRNARNVQTWPTQGLGSFRVNGKTLTHFAAFSKALATWCILASCPAQCCGICGAGFKRMVELGELREHPQRQGRNVRNVGNLPLGGEAYSTNGGTLGLVRDTRTLGWSPTCACPQDVPPVPGLVLDPFVGSGTTALAAQELGRRCIGIDLSADYIALAWRRLRSTTPAMPGLV